MIINEYIAKDTENKDRLFINVDCDICHSIFQRQKRFIKTHTCSERCRNVLQGNTIVTTCGHCNKIFDIAKSKKLDINYCSRNCKDASSINTNYRQKAIRHYGAICQKCGFDNIKAIEVHHIDKDRSNNNIENLQVLCCNCHSITHRGI